MFLHERIKRHDFKSTEKHVLANNVTYPWCISFTLHARKCPWPILVRAQVPSFHVIIHCNGLERIYPPCYWERAELTDLGQIAPWTWSLYFEFLLLINSTNSLARVQATVMFSSQQLNPLKKFFRSSTHTQIRIRNTDEAKTKLLAGIEDDENSSVALLLQWYYS